MLKFCAILVFWGAIPFIAIVVHLNDIKQDEFFLRGP